MSELAPGAEGRDRAGITLPALPGRLAQIDLLKGLAIVAVLFLHGLPTAVLTDGAAVFYIGQAVPVFIVLMGLNATASFWQAGRAPLSRLYSRAYVAGRIDRLYVPFLFLLAASSLIALAEGTLTPGGVVSGLVGGTLPYSGPGNYFVTFAFEFAVAFPLFYWCYRRAPVASVVAGFGVAAAFELFAAHVSVFDANKYVYSAAIIRFIPFFALGSLLADHMLTGRRLSWWWLVGAAASTAYLEIVYLDANAFPLADEDWRRWGQTFASAFYPAILVVAGLRYLPATLTRQSWRLVARLGAASYEIFLVQILWFSLVAPPSLAKLGPSIVACCLIGWTFHMGLRRVPHLATRRLAVSR